MADVLLPEVLIAGKDNGLEVKRDRDKAYEMMTLMTLTVFFSNEY